ncbi:MAG: lysine--tRNA ligase [Candidatus Omnitrophota bacterium]
MELNEIIQQRRAKLEALKAKGVSLKGAISTSRTDIGESLADFQEGKKVTFCGRVTAKRLHGKVEFLDLKDRTGKIQLYLKADLIGSEQFEILKEDIDIADFLSVKGELFKTRSGELSVKVDEFVLLSKALRPLPEKWHGLKDIELRYRQRYLDLIANEEVKKVFLARSKIIQAIRRFLEDRGFLEVETPMMHSIAGGAAGRPFKTHHNEYDQELFLRIAPELYLKRLIVAGLDRVYEINRSFRNEGVSTRHNPEFTMLEVYQAYANYEEMMQLTQDLVCSVAKEVLGSTKITYQGKTVDLTPPWQKRSFYEMVKERFDIEPQDETSVMIEKLQRKGFAKDKNRLTRSQINKIIEDILGQDMSPVRDKMSETSDGHFRRPVSNGVSSNPTFVTDYFTNLCPLAQTRQDNPLLSERFELYVAGLEVANAYSELNDPIEQRKRFQEEIKELEKDEKKDLDEDYLLALEHGMPPTGGLGIGIDRLVMLLTDQASIRDVILFPLLRPGSNS